MPSPNFSDLGHWGSVIIDTAGVGVHGHRWAHQVCANRRRFRMVAWPALDEIPADETCYICDRSVAYPGQTDR